MSSDKNTKNICVLLAIYVNVEPTINIQTLLIHNFNCRSRVIILMKLVPKLPNFRIASTNESAIRKHPAAVERTGARWC